MCCGNCLSVGKANTMCSGLGKAAEMGITTSSGPRVSRTERLALSSRF
jgi:hypothetical protein